MNLSGCFRFKVFLNFSVLNVSEFFWMSRIWAFLAFQIWSFLNLSGSGSLGCSEFFGFEFSEFFSSAFLLTLPDFEFCWILSFEFSCFFGCWILLNLSGPGSLSFSQFLWIFQLWVSLTSADLEFSEFSDLGLFKLLRLKFSGFFQAWISSWSDDYSGISLNLSDNVW